MTITEHLSYPQTMGCILSLCLQICTQAVRNMCPSWPFLSPSCRQSRTLVISDKSQGLHFNGLSVSLTIVWLFFFSLNQGGYFTKTSLSKSRNCRNIIFLTRLICEGCRWAPQGHTWGSMACNHQAACLKAGLALMISVGSSWRKLRL